jgi:deoxyribonuclease-4
MQIFSRNPRGWESVPLHRKSIQSFHEEVRRSPIDPIVIHTPYLLNLASSDPKLYQRSVNVLIQDLKRAEQLGANSVVTHLGSAKDRSLAYGRKQVVKALKRVLELDFSVFLLLENSAGVGRTVGASLEEMAEIIQGAGGDPRVGFCFDSCHGYAAGYEFSSEEMSEKLVRHIHRCLGLDRLKLLHLNDSAGSPGSRLDRHQHIGKGKIGLKGFRSLLRQEVFRRTPMILETPKKGPQDDLKNLSRIRDIFFSFPTA